VSVSKYDYDALEQEFIQGPDELSVRELAKRHGIASWSTVNVQANKREWARKRAEFRAKVNQKSLALSADKVATKIAEIEEDFLTVLQAGLRKLAMDMRDRTIEDYDVVTHKPFRRVIPGQTITPESIVKMIGAMQNLRGKPSSITEERLLGLDLTALGLPAEDLRRIAELTAEPDGRPASRAALPSPRSAGPN